MPGRDQRLCTPVTLAMLAGLLAALSASAQWVNYPIAGTPRNGDGRPNLLAPSPRTEDGKPDLSGIWQAAHRLPCDGINRVCTDLPISPQFGNLGAGLKGGLPYQPWARDRIRQKGPTDDPYVRCVTPGGPRMHLLPTMKKFVQARNLLVILNEYNTNFRQIFLDGRPLPDDPQPTWNGYSTGKWDDDTLVVESTGFRDDQWLDAAGSPLTSAAKVVERFRRPNYGSLKIEITVNDPKAYTAPWIVTLDQDLAPDTDLLDSVCMENERDVDHLRSK